MNNVHRVDTSTWLAVIWCIYNQRLCGVKLCLVMALRSLSKIIQTKYHSKEFNDWKWIFVTVVKFWLLKGALVPWESSKEVLCFPNFPTSYVSFESAGLRKMHYEVGHCIERLV